MGDYSKFNVVYRLQKWMDSVPGQTFLNYAYSWGASIVIAGAMFKLTHLPGANFMLFLGMGTEVLVFFLSAFDRPFDKTAEGRDIPTHVTEDYLETGRVEYGEQGEASTDAQQPVQSAQPVQPAQPSILFAQNGRVASPVQQATSSAEPAVEESAPISSVVNEQPAAVAQGAQPVAAPVAEGVTIPAGNVAWVGGQQNVTPEMAEAQSNYVEELKKLVETLEKVNEQSTRLTRDSEEMENLNRTLTGISKVYEMQLKGASQQIGTIDQINEQSRKMAQQIEQLNKIYARMIEAMTVNMRVAAPNVKTEE